MSDFPTGSINEFIVWIIGLIIIYTILYFLVGGGISFIFWLISMGGGK